MLRAHSRTLQCLLPISCTGISLFTPAHLHKLASAIASIGNR